MNSSATFDAGPGRDLTTFDDLAGTMGPENATRLLDHLLHRLDSRGRAYWRTRELDDLLDTVHFEASVRGIARRRSAR